MAGKYRRPSTPDQRAEADAAREAKLAALHQTLTEQVSALATGPQWCRWLEVAAKFHHYSFNNTLLLCTQKADATQVAGYKVWQELNRQVTKGEKGLMILAPVTRKVDQSAEATQTGNPGADPTAEATTTSSETAGSARRVVGFRPVYVWDISQTTGDALPEPPTPQLLAGHAPEGLWEALVAQCETAGYTVARRPIDADDGPNGYTDFTTRKVVVRSDVDEAQAVKTLAHELAHVLMHDPGSFSAGHTEGCRGACEVEAESVAYLVAADHGLDTAEYTFAYVAGWAAHTGDVDAALAAAGNRVLGTARQVLDTSHARMNPPSAHDAAQTVTATSDLAVRSADGAERTAALSENPDAEGNTGPTKGVVPVMDDAICQLGRGLDHVVASVHRAQRAVEASNCEHSGAAARFTRADEPGYTDSHRVSRATDHGRRMGQ